MRHFRQSAQHPFATIWHSTFEDLAQKASLDICVLQCMGIHTEGTSLYGRTQPRNVSIILLSSAASTGAEIQLERLGTHDCWSHARSMLAHQGVCILSQLLF